MKYTNNPQLTGWLKKTGFPDLSSHAEFALDDAQFQKHLSEVRGRPASERQDAAAYRCLTWGASADRGKAMTTNHHSENLEIGRDVRNIAKSLWWLLVGVWAIFLLLILLSSTAHAQTLRSVNAQQFTARIDLSASTQTSASMDLRGTGISYHKFSWNTTGSLSAGACELQQSADNSSFSTLIAAQTVTSTGGPTALTAGVVNYVRWACSTPIVGSGTATLVYYGYVDRIANISGTGVNGDCVQWTGTSTVGDAGAACGSGSGGITGPGSSTDNAVVRWDGTTGTAIQNSSVIVSDGGLLGIGVAPTYGLHIAATSGLTAGQTALIQDATGTTGITTAVIKAGAGQGSGYSAANLVALTAAGARTYGIGIYDGDGTLYFTRSDHSSALAIQVNASSIVIKPSQSTNTSFQFYIPDGGLVFTASGAGAGGAKIQFGRRPSDDNVAVGASSEFWPKSGQTNPTMAAMAAGGASYVFQVMESGLLKFGSSGDLGASRNAAGVLEINNGTAGTFRDLKPRGIVGTTTNDNAQAGSYGEYVSSNIASGSAVSLTAGDWDVEGSVSFSTSGASSSDFKVGSHSTSATFGADNTWANTPLIATGLSDVFTEEVPAQRFSLSGTTTIYLIGQATFSLGTITGYGLLRARRVR